MSYDADPSVNGEMVEGATGAMERASLSAVATDGPALAVRVVGFLPSGVADARREEIAGLAKFLEGAMNGLLARVAAGKRAGKSYAAVLSIGEHRDGEGQMKASLSLALGMDAEALLRGEKPGSSRLVVPGLKAGEGGT